MASPETGADTVTAAGFWPAPIARIIAATDWSKVGFCLAVLIIAAIGVTLYDTLDQLRWADVVAAVDAVPNINILAAFVATAASYLALVGYEFIAVRQVGANKVSPLYAAVTAFIGYSFTFVLGFGVLTGGAVRLRRYLALGLGSGQIVGITLLGVVSFWAGLAAIAGLCLVVSPGVLASWLGLPAIADRILGAAVLLAIAGWIVASAMREWTIPISDWKLRLPGPAMSLGVIALGLADTGFAALALWLIMPQSADIGFAAFLLIFSLATVAGVLSHAPGGVGAFEAVIILSLPSVDHAGTVGSLLLFRLVYYAVPFLLGAAAFGIDEARARPDRLKSAQRLLARTVRPILPNLAAFAVFFGGAVLLLSGSLPPVGSRFSLLMEFVPLPFVETSHFVASVVGGVLLITGYGLARRLRSSWTLAVILLTAGAAFSLLKGFAYEEAIDCLVVLAMLVATRGEFYRYGGLAEQMPSLRWLVAGLSVLALCLLVGLIVYRDVEYSNTLWWQFGAPGHAPSFLRAMLGAAVVLILGFGYRLLHAPTHNFEPPVADEPARIEAAVANSDQTSSNLAFLGDKRFLFSDAGPGFIMYGVSGSTWLAMSDPVCVDEKVSVDLIWRFKELAHLHAGHAAFYQVSAEMLPIFIDAGFSFAKLGEEAIVDLNTFSLEGSANAKFRQAKSRSERVGLSFAIIPAAEVGARLPELKAISDAWLGHQKRHEKGFSLGFFDDDYLSRFDCALVTLHGEPIAFANIWKTAGRSEYSIDLMRHLPDMPNGTMDYLFVCLLLAAKADGVRSFNLGMAPLAGLPEHRLAPAWTRFGGLIYRHGNQYYNFKGLRDFKSKFHPEWQPRYLAHPGGLSVARILVDATLLISKGPLLIEEASSHDTENHLLVDRAARARARISRTRLGGSAVEHGLH